MFKKLNLLFAATIFSAVSLFSQVGLNMPTPRVLNEAVMNGEATVFPVGQYSFTEWASTQASNTYPSNMLFYFLKNNDPNITEELGTVYADVYSATSTGKINGRGALGVSIGSGSSKLGAAVLAMNTTGRTNINVAWSASTVVAASNSTAGNVPKIFNITLQYRLNTTGEWTTIPNNTFTSQAAAGDFSNFTAVLPSECDNQALVQLRWVYYWSNRVVATDGNTSGSTRPRLGLDEIHVTSTSMGEIVPTQLVFNSISNNPVAAGVPFEINFKTKNAAGAIGGVSAATEVELVKLNVASGVITQVPGWTQTIAAGNSDVTFSNLVLNTIGTNTLVLRRNTGDVLIADTFNVEVINVPAKLWFSNLFTKGHATMPLPPFTVLAKNADGTMNSLFNGTVNIVALPIDTILATAEAVNGVAQFPNFIINVPGTYLMAAKAVGVPAYDEVTVNINPAVVFEEILVPRYMAGCISYGSKNDSAGYSALHFAPEDRIDDDTDPKHKWTVPVYSMVKVKNLHPNMEYRYTTRVQYANNSANNSTYGNNINYDMVNDSAYYSGRFIKNLDTDSLKQPEPYSSFIINSANSINDKVVFLNVVPNANGYFLNNAKVNWIMNLADETGKIFTRFRSQDTTKALSYGVGSSNITGIADKNSRLPEGHFLALYSGEELLTLAPVQNDGVELYDVSGFKENGERYDQSGPHFYKQLDLRANAWATIIPNNKGISKIVEYDLDGNIVNTWEDADGVWAGVKTNNLTGGMVAPVYFGTPFIAQNITIAPRNCNANGVNITCDVHGVDSVNIYYSIDGGLTYQLAAAGVTTTKINDENSILDYTWDCAGFTNFEMNTKIKVVSAAQPNVLAESNEFKIYQSSEFTSVTGEGLYCKGSRIVLTANVVNPQVTYTWLKDGKVISGATANTLEITNATHYHSAIYNCITHHTGLNPCTDVMSNDVVVYIIENTRITKQPQPAYINLGGMARFSVESHASGVAPAYTPKYQWYKGETALENSAKYLGANSNVLYILNVNNEDTNADFWVKITGLCGDATSERQRIRLVNLAVQSISADTSVCEGGTATLSVKATSSATDLDYTWYFNEGEISNSNANTLVLSEIPAFRGGEYSVKITERNSGYSIMSNNVKVNVYTRPVITLEPNAAYSVNASDPVELRVEVAPTFPVTYQWYHDGNPIADAKSNVYEFPVFTVAETGTYYCKLTNDCGETVTRNIKVELLNSKYLASVTDATMNGYVLSAPVPNPVANNSVIKYFVPEVSDVKITLLDASGKAIATILNELINEGQHEVRFDAQSYNLSSGVYYYLLESNNASLLNKIIIAK